MPISATKKVDQLRLVEEYAGGLGGVIEIPLARATAGIIAGKTYGGGSGTFDLTLESFREMERNFPKRPGVPKVYFTHDYDVRVSQEGEIPVGACGVILGIGVEGDQLWGRLQLGPDAWRVVVTNPQFHGFSIEWNADQTMANGVRLEGSYLTGGIFTNSQVLDVAFVRAASADPGRRFTTPHFWGQEDETMADKTLADLQAENTALGKKLEAADTAKTEQDRRLTALEDENRKLKARQDPPKQDEAVRALEASNNELKAENRGLAESVKALQEQGTIRDVRAIFVSAIQPDGDGKAVAPAFFTCSDGKPATEQPLKFLAENGGTVSALEGIVKRLPRVSMGQKGVGTGEALGAASDGDGDRLWAEVRKVAADRKCSFDEAREAVRASNPQLYAAATRRPTPVSSMNAS